MNKESAKSYWTGSAHRAGRASASEPEPGIAEPVTVSRRHFLEAAGFTCSLLAVGGCNRSPTRLSLPFAYQPEGVIPGRMQHYASTCAGCPAACGLLVGVRDGRPLKMEGLPEHPLSRGGLCAVGQASPLGLYDSHRLPGPLRKGETAKWSDVDRAITEQLDAIRGSGGAVRFVTQTVTSPTLKTNMDAFLESFDDARHVTFDAISSSAILDAHLQTHGTRVLPHYHLDRAQVILSLGADFLGTWISPVEFTAAWRTRRVPTEEHPEMSHHLQLEGRMSLTGGNADVRYRVAPDEYGGVLSHLAVNLAERAGQSPPSGTLGKSPLPAHVMEEISQRLWEARGECVVLCDSQEIATQRLVNFVNHALGNYGKTVDIACPSRQRQGSDSDILRLVEELESGQVSALLVAGTDLTHNLPNRQALAEAIAKVPLVVSFSEREDDFASLAHFVCPDHHPLESWMDAEPLSGVVSLSQPTLQPLRETRSILESLSAWSGRFESAHGILRATWKRDILPRAKAQSFDAFWDQAVHDGMVQVTPNAVTAKEFQSDSVTLTPGPPAAEGYLLALYAKVGMPDSRHAHNPWLQELPDPTTKATWDNYVCVSPAIARELQLSDGDMVSVSDGVQGLELPVLIQPGQHDRVLAIALGFGVKGTDRFAKAGPPWLEARPTVAEGELVGQNAAGLIGVSGGALQYVRNDVTLEKIEGRHDLATTQTHHSLEVPKNIAPHGGEIRHAVQETSLAAYIENPESGAPAAHHSSDHQLWSEDHPKTGHAWGMVVDLNACTGCSACVIACQSENNVPVVGKDEVRRRREMHWMRIDRYYSGAGDEVDVSHQPMMCQHCDNAPCETVCPVLATAHSDEGLNEQTYNRCVGTRYCANNCPYKVRRFNWFKYSRDDQLQNLALNPDVTVRARGVMEKCSMCVQRIEDGKIQAKHRGQPLADGAIQTACQQSCPAQAITFGDMNDPDSQVYAALNSVRRYRVLEEFNFRPSVAYLRIVKNCEEKQVEGGHHG